MGTRSLVKVKDGKATVACIYRQYDGYPAGMGQDLFDVLAYSVIINRFRSSDVSPAKFNGMGCLAAWLVGHLKKNEIGNVYMMSPGTKMDNCSAEYEYTLTETRGHLRITVKNWKGQPLYKGTLAGFGFWLKRNTA